ncbi:MAG: MFS transporter, partial [Candidatus Dormiibacterota bacterium]
LLRGPTLRALLFTVVFYALWNTAAGTNGFFLPYLLRTVGAQSQAASVAFQCLSFVLTMLAVVLLFMRFADGSHRRLMFGFGFVMQVFAFLPLVFFRLSTPLALVNIVLFGVGAALAGEPFYRVWSQELFPTMLRGTAQGITFFIARLEIGIWSFFVPILVSTTGGFHGMALVLTVLLFISGLVGLIWMPNTAGRSLREIESERWGAAPEGPRPRVRGA